MSELKAMSHRLCLEIEKLPASEQQTKVSVMASELSQAIRAHLTQLALDGARVAHHCEHGYNGVCPECGAVQTPPRQ
jgi:hypothetical protein